MNSLLLKARHLLSVKQLAALTITARSSVNSTALACHKAYHTTGRCQKPNATEQPVKDTEKFVVNTYARPSLVISHGKGSYVYDTDGNEYLDFTAGIAVTALGHSHPDVSAAVTDQATKLIHCSNLYHNEWAPTLARKLVDATLSAFPQGTQGIYAKDNGSPRVFFSNSGTEANEGALKFARKYGKYLAAMDTSSPALRNDPNLKCGIVSFTNGFHGRSMGALSVTANPKYQKPFAPLIPGVQTTKFNSTKELSSFVDERTCAVIVEPFQGEGGINQADVDFLSALRRRCDQVGALLIYDEIQCGLGRTGHLWAHQMYPADCSPDIVTMAKPLANGIPIGAIMTSGRIADAIAVGDHGTTFGGNPLACRVGCAVLDIINSPNTLAHVSAAGAALERELQTVLGPYFGETVEELRGVGLLRGIRFTSDPSKLIELARKRGLLLVAAGNNTIRLVPPLNTSLADIKKAAGIIGDCFKEMK